MNLPKLLLPVIIAFPSKVHFDITQRASSRVPDDIRLLLDRLPQLVVDVDIELANIPHANFGDITREGQKHHFMLAEGQSQEDAYKECLHWIFINSRDSLQRIMQWRAASERAKKWINPFESPRSIPGETAASPLARALHSIQDSFSAAHVHRIEKEPFIITRILPWDDENMKPGLDAGKPGAIEWDEARNRPGPGWKGHSAYDDEWNKAMDGADNASKTRAGVAINASGDLITLIVKAASSGDPQNSFYAQMVPFLERYFSMRRLKD